MPPAAGLPELDVARVQRWCAARVPDHARDQVRVEYEINRSYLTILECRAPWRAEAGSEWTRFPIARLRYTHTSATWTLYWRDRNLRFHRYDRSGWECSGPFGGPGEGQPPGGRSGGDSPGVGAALLGMDALGMLGSLDAAADIVTVTDTARPDRVETEAYARLVPIFDRAYEALVPTFADLADAAAHLPLRARST